MDWLSLFVGAAIGFVLGFVMAGRGDAINLSESFRLAIWELKRDLGKDETISVEFAVSRYGDDDGDEKDFDFMPKGRYEEN